MKFYRYLAYLCVFGFAVCACVHMFYSKTISGSTTVKKYSIHSIESNQIYSEEITADAIKINQLKQDKKRTNVDDIEAYLARLKNGDSLSKNEFRQLTSDWDRLLNYLNDNAELVSELALQSANQQQVFGENNHSALINHIFKQLPFNTLIEASYQQVYSTDSLERKSAIQLIEFAYQAKDLELNSKGELQQLLETIIYTDLNFDNKVAAFDVLANYEWHNTDIEHLRALDGVFDVGVDKVVKARALQTAAVFGGQVDGFESELISRLSDTSTQGRLAGLSALSTLAIFVDKTDNKQLGLLNTMKANLISLIDNEPKDSYLYIRANRILNKHFSS